MKPFVLTMAVAVAACSRYTAPKAPAPREATLVKAPVGRTWDAVIDIFAGHGIPIRTIERVSGLIVTDELRVGDEGRGLADCGKLNGDSIYPNFARYNALVRGDSSASSVKVTVVWTHVSEKTIVKDCSTSHKFEQTFEAQVKSRAEDSSLTSAQRMAFEPPEPSGAPNPAAGAHGSPRTPNRPAPPDSGNSGTANLRTRAELLINPNFNQAIGDMFRKGLVLGFREVGQERLEVDLSASALTLPSLEYQLTRLFLAYGTTLVDATNPVMVLLANGTMAGEYTRAGMQWVRNEP